MSTEKNNRKKIVLVVPTLSTGGAEKFVCDMALNIDREKFDISVIVLFSRTGGKKESDLEASNIPVYYLNKKRGLSIKCIFALKHLLKRLRPDVVHSHLDVLLYLLPSYKRSQVKIHTVHSMAQFEATGFNKLIRIIAFKFYGVKPVAIGEKVRDSISTYYKIPLIKIPCIYNGVIEPLSTSREKHQGTVFINIGTLYHIKNQEMLIRAFKRCKELSMQPISLNIVGDGELYDNLQKLIRELELEQNVRLTGWTDDVYAELLRADIYVCSSKMEGVSLSVIEAMLCGLPIIASNVGGNKDLVRPNINGILFENENEDALVKAMMQMLDDYKFQRSCSEASFELSRRFTISVCAREYEKLYLC